MKLYVWITRDKYQLPRYVATNAQEMARVSGYKASTIYKQVSKGSEKFVDNPCFIAVEVDG